VSAGFRTGFQHGFDDSDVLGRARAGDERAFLALYRAAQPGLLRYLSVIVGDAAEQIAADTWIEVAEELRSYTGTLDSFRGWVAGKGRRRALDYQAGVRVTHPDAVTLPLDVSAGPLSPRTARALGLIAELSKTEAEAVALRSVMGLDESQAASVLGVRRGVLRRAALRGLRALTRLLDPDPVPNAPVTVDLARDLDRDLTRGSGVHALRLGDALTPSRGIEVSS
jgi:RNA polymerase sigma-70 factor (ECF subfamily)